MALYFFFESYEQVWMSVWTLTSKLWRWPSKTENPLSWSLSVSVATTSAISSCPTVFLWTRCWSTSSLKSSQRRERLVSYGKYHLNWWLWNLGIDWLSVKMYNCFPCLSCSCWPRSRKRTGSWQRKRTWPRRAEEMNLLSTLVGFVQHFFVLYFENILILTCLHFVH